MVVEQGVYQLSGGGQLVAGKQNVTQSNTTNFTNISYAQTFAQAPIVLAQVMTAAGADTAFARLATINNGPTFNVKLQEQKGADGIHTTAESVGYIAMDAGNGTTPGVSNYQAILTSDTITDAWSTWNFSAGLGAQPLVLAATQTNHDADPAWARIHGVSGAGVSLHVEEDTSTSTTHTHENVALLAFAQSGFLYKDFPAATGPTTSYVYDAQGRRVKRTHDPDGTGTAQAGTSEYFVYDGDDLSMRFGNAQELTHRYLNGPLSDQVLVDEVFSAGAGGQRVSSDVLWQLADQQGTIRDIVDDAGTLRKHIDYDSVGKITGEQFYSQTGASISSTHAEAVDQLFTYDGQELDKSTGLLKMGARWYAPTTGRFVSEDPSGLDPDANPFRFVHNSYPNYTDPTGLSQAGNPLNGLFSSLGQSSTPLLNNPVANRPVVNQAHVDAFTTQQAFYSRQVDFVRSQLDVARQARDGRSWYEWHDKGTDRARIADLENQFVYYNGLRNVAGDNIRNASLGDPIHTNSGTQYESVGGAFGRGLQTGNKAISNAAISTATLGYSQNYFAPTQWDIDNGYYASRAIAGVSTEILAAVGTGGLATVTKGGTALRVASKAALAFDTTSNVVGVGQGATDAYNNGLSFGNATQIVGGGLGLGGNFAAGGRTLGELASDAGRVRVSFDPATASMGGVGGVNVSLAPSTSSGGRLGSAATRQHVGEVASELRSRGYEVIGGGGVRAEEYIPGSAGRKGSAYPDITATKNGRTLRINTIDTLSDGLTPTAREAANAAKIRQLIGNEHLLLIPKP